MGVHTLGTATEWQAGVELAMCFVHACDNRDIDPRGPVFLRDDATPRYACTPHWEGVFRVLGEGEQDHTTSERSVRHILRWFTGRR